MIKKTFFILLSLFLLLITSVNAIQPNVVRSKKTAVLFPDGQKAEAVIADDMISRTTGLMGRAQLNLNEGMLFLFDTNEPHMMWMKNMLIPIDMIWLNDQKAIIDIVQSAPPCHAEPCAVYGPRSPSRYVLELKDGAAKIFHLKKGITLKF